jgi:hypothetical protein
VSGNIVEANFGLSSSNAWFQVSGTDIRSDGVTDPIPASPVCTNVAIRNGNGGTPGIIFSQTGSIDLGSGQASEKNWLVTNSTPSTGGGRSPTAYDTMLATLQGNKITPQALSCSSSDAGCSLTDTLESTAYQVTNGNLTLNSADIRTKKVLILVDGDLTINGPVRVSPGAYLMFVVKGDIIVSPTVGTTTVACAGAGTPQLQGVFSTDQNFIIQGNATCPTPDRQLQFAGSIITNASRTTGGTLQNNRTLCTGDINYPSLTLAPRLDFPLFAPTYLLKPSLTWQEVAP